MLVCLTPPSEPSFQPLRIARELATSVTERLPHSAESFLRLGGQADVRFLVVSQAGEDGDDPVFESDAHRLEEEKPESAALGEGVVEYVVSCRVDEAGIEEGGV